MMIQSKINALKRLKEEYISINKSVNFNELELLMKIIISNGELPLTDIKILLTNTADLFYLLIFQMIIQIQSLK